MWICFNDGFVSVVRNRDDERQLLVRARRRDILETLLPGRPILVLEEADYLYRVFVDEAEFADIVRQRVLGIGYDNFKDSVKDKELKKLYSGFWENHWSYQR